MGLVQAGKPFPIAPGTACAETVSVTPVKRLIRARKTVRFAGTFYAQVAKPRSRAPRTAKSAETASATEPKPFSLVPAIVQLRAETGRAKPQMKPIQSVRTTVWLPAETEPARAQAKI